jgi:glutamate carboxypeptidase
MTHAIREAAQARRDDYLQTLRSLVELESPTHDKRAADRLAEHLEMLLQREGWKVERHAQERVGDHLVARFDAPGDEGILILAHYDTVWPVGTLKEMPFRITGTKAYGPGILDMKAGIMTAVFSVNVVRQLGLGLRGPITMLLTSDEETGSKTSRGLIERHCKGQSRVLVVEPGNDDGALKIRRKGGGGFGVRFEGRSAHAGNNPQDGASALRELAHFLLFAEGLTDEDLGTSVNLTVAEGGSVSNVIAERATAKLDLRALTLDEARRVVEALRSYRPRDGRVRIFVEGGLNRPPLEFTAKNKALFNEAVICGATMEVAVAGAVAGGGSDGNFSSALGVATLDGLGAVGQGPHARHEHIDIPATLDRIALMACLLSP